jgi:hypothetical protein
MVVRIEAADVIDLIRRPLGLPKTFGLQDDAFISALVRRAASYLCPCTSRVLVRAIMEGLQGLADQPERLEERVEDAVDKALIAGDLLELAQVSFSSPAAKSTWLFAAPPAFVARPSGNAFLMGVALDEPTPLPASLASRVVYDGHYRLIPKQGDEDLPFVLRELGLLELGVRTWLREPKAEEAQIVTERYERELMNQGPAGEVAGLTILDTAAKPTFYRGRWTTPKKQSGFFVARRPQAYGADLWGFALLQNGALMKFLDFPRKHERWRGSDVAWHLQMALDHGAGNPQRYRVRRTGGVTILDFFSPLPSWAERRLAAIGRPAAREHCLFSYQFAESEIPTETAFLEANLWLAPAQASEGD